MYENGPGKIDMNQISEAYGYEADQMSIEEGLAHGPDSKGPKTGELSTQFNIMNTVMGIAILSLPSVFKATGILAGAIFMVIFMFCHYWSCVYLIKTKNLTKHANYTTIGRFAVGSWVVPIVKFVMIFNAIGVCQLYLDIFHSVLETVFVILLGFNQDTNPTVYWIFHERYIVIPCAALCLLPFAFQKSTDGLKWVSYVGMCSCIIFVISIIVAFFIQFDTIGERDIGYLWTTNTGMHSFTQFASHLPQIIMAFTFQFNLFSFYKSLDKSSDEKMLKITFRSISSVCVIYLIVAILGYISFGDAIEAKIINNFNNNKEKFGTFF